MKLNWLLFTTCCTLIAAVAFYLGSYFLLVQKSKLTVTPSGVEHAPSYGRFLGFSEQRKKEFFERANVLDKEIIRRKMWKRPDIEYIPGIGFVGF
jgi:hypothetical protein